MKKIITGILFCLTGGLLQAQDVLPEKEPNRIMLVGKYLGDSLVLRFAPTTAIAWHRGNTDGYQIERREFSAESLKDSGPFQKVNQTPFKPLPLEDWEGLVGDPVNPDRNAAIAAQSIYGKPNTPPGSIFEQADLLQNNYAMALLAAEFSPKVAEASGLRWVDKDIKPNTGYIYRVYALSNQDKIDTAYVVVSTREVVPTPRPELLEVVSLEDRIILHWSVLRHQSLFSAYYIERSEDQGATYKRLNAIPYIGMGTKDHPVETNFSYTDSVKTLYKPYLYRLVGLTTYGEISSPSEPVAGMAKDMTPPNRPSDVVAKHLGGSHIEISWESDNVPDLKGFMIGKSGRTDIQYQPISTVLSPDTRSFIDTAANVTGTNYYIVVAVDTANNGSASLYAFSTVRDTIPPSIPKGLHGKIDTNGIVTLRWNHSPERDVKGYKVVYANSTTDRYILASKDLVRDSVWRDTIHLQTLTKDIYYKVMAIDLVDNYSDFSEPVRLTKPDIVPPVSPIFKDFFVSAEGIRLNWVTSVSTDVAFHRLERKKTAEEKWNTVTRLPFKGNRKEEFLDKTVEPANSYEYRVIAIDDSGLESEPSPTLYLKSGDFRALETVKNLKARYNETTRSIEISWDKGNYEVLLYKADTGGNFATLSKLPGSTILYTDKQVNGGKTYRYIAKVMYPNGRTSAFSPEVTVITN